MYAQQRVNVGGSNSLSQLIFISFCFLQLPSDLMIASDKAILMWTP